MTTLQAPHRASSRPAPRGLDLLLHHPDQLRAYAQPIMPAGLDDHDRHAEMLVRLHHPDTGQPVSPAAFLPAAEQGGFIGLIDQFMLREAIRVAGTRPVTLWVNLSAHTLTQPHLPLLVTAAGGLTGLTGQLVVEMTETAPVTDLATVRRNIAWLAERHVRFALDDFGATVATFAHLHQLPAPIVKIDGQYARNATRAGQDALTRMVATARSGGAKVVVEHAEDAAGLQRALTAGADFVQGHVFGLPEPVDALIDRLLTPPAALAS